MDAVQSTANAELVARFYAAFAALDAATMAACYAPEVRFEDPVFQLKGKDEVMSMWSMLGAATRATSLDVWKLEWRDVEAEAHSGRAHWEAHYRFSATGRLVHNIIEAEFEFRDGLIVAQRDRFGFWRWSRQALGAPGWLLGWTPFLRSKVQAQAAANLQKFLAARAG